MIYIRTIIKDVLKKQYNFVEGTRLENRSRRLASRYQFDPLITEHLTIKGYGSGKKYVINDTVTVEDRIKELIEKESKPTFTSLVRKVTQEELGLKGKELKNKTIRFLHRFSTDSEINDYLLPTGDSRATRYEVLVPEWVEERLRELIKSTKPNLEAGLNNDNDLNLKTRHERIKELRKKFKKPYQDLLKLTDAELRIHNSNERILPNDPVYNSDKTHRITKTKIKTRQLGRIEPEDFLEQYNEILDGLVIKGSNVNYRLRETRLKAGLTQDQLGKKAGVAYSSIGVYETVRSPSPKVAKKLGEILGVDIEELFPDIYTKQRVDSKREMINEKFREARIRKGLTMSELADITEIKRVTLTTYESMRNYPNKKNAEKIARALNIPVEELFSSKIKQISQLLYHSERKDHHRTEKRIADLKTQINDKNKDQIKLRIQEAKTLYLPLDIDQIPEEDLSKNAIELNYFNGNLRERLIELLDTLPERGCRILKLRYGLDDSNTEQLSLIETGEIFDISKERTRQIEEEELKVLKKSANSISLKDVQDHERSKRVRILIDLEQALK